MLPFTAEDLFGVFASYNESIWPMQLVAYAIGVLALLFVRAPRQDLQRAAFVLVSLLWLWTGISYFVMHLHQISPLGQPFGFAFLLGAGALVAFGLGATWPRPRRAALPRLALGALLAAYALLFYPLLLTQAGHAYPAQPSFGLTPCPLVIFTFALLLLTPVRPYRWLYILPAAWAVIGGSAALLLGVLPDIALPLSAALALAYSGGGLRRQRRQSQLTASSSPQPA